MNTKLGIFLKNKRLAKGLSRKQFVDLMPEETRISSSTLGQIENGKIKKPPEKRLVGFSIVLGISLKAIKQLLIASALVISSFLFPKEAAAIKLIQKFEPQEGYHLAFSGGKDSCVIKYLAQKAGVKFKAHMGLTTIDFPELIQFVKQYHPDTVLHKPKLSMYKLISQVKHSLPTRIGRYCCEHLKEYLGKGEFVMQGIRWEESPGKRGKRTFFEYDTRSSMNDKMYLNPIIDWTSNDIWNYIHHYNIPYCDLYNKGYKRLGCIGCPMSGPNTMKHELESYPKYKGMYLKAIKKAQSAMNQKGQPYAIKTNFIDEVDAYNWWVSGLSLKEFHASKKQLSIFDQLNGVPDANTNPKGMGESNDITPI